MQNPPPPHQPPDRFDLCECSEKSPTMISVRGTHGCRACHASRSRWTCTNFDCRPARRSSLQTHSDEDRSIPLKFPGGLEIPIDTKPTFCVRIPQNESVHWTDFRSNRVALRDSVHQVGWPVDSQLNHGRYLPGNSGRTTNFSCTMHLVPFIFDSSSQTSTGTR